MIRWKKKNQKTITKQRESTAWNIQLSGLIFGYWEYFSYEIYTFFSILSCCVWAMSTGWSWTFYGSKLNLFNLWLHQYQNNIYTYTAVPSAQCYNTTNHFPKFRLSTHEIVSDAGARLFYHSPTHKYTHWRLRQKSFFFFAASCPFDIFFYTKTKDIHCEHS